MINVHSLLLYVTDPQESAGYYASLLECEPMDASPTFVMFALPSGLRLGLWRKDGVDPSPVAPGGGQEIGIHVQDPDSVDAMHKTWSEKGAVITMPPTDLDFGRSFVATDPDGHRLRVYSVAQ